MAKLKYLKLPKKPKANASLDAMNNWLEKVKAVKAENQHRWKLNYEATKTRKVIAGIGSTYVMPSGFKAVTVRPKKSGKKSSVSGVRKKRITKSKTARRRR